MNKLLSTLFVVLSITLSNAQDYAAGVLPYRIGDDDEIYILLGRNENGFWEDFIGCYEKFDGGDLIETATREFHQETNCYFERDQLRSSIYLEREKAIQLKKNVYRFIIEIDNIDPDHIKNSPFGCIELVEKDDWRWLKLSEIEKAIEKSTTNLDVIVFFDDNSNSIKLDKIMKDGFLPKSETMAFFALMKKN